MRHILFLLALCAGAAAVVVLAAPLARALLAMPAGSIRLTPAFQAMGWNALGASAAALPLGAASAAGLARTRPAWRLLVCSLCILALLAAFAGGAPPQANAVPRFVEQLAFALPIVILILTPRLERLDPVLLEAAAASGASVWFRVTVILLPWIGWTACAAFALSLAGTFSLAGRLAGLR